MTKPYRFSTPCHCPWTVSESREILLFLTLEHSRNPELCFLHELPQNQDNIKGSQPETKYALPGHTCAMLWLVITENSALGCIKEI